MLRRVHVFAAFDFCTYSLSISSTGMWYVLVCMFIRVVVVLVYVVCVPNIGYIWMWVYDADVCLESRPVHPHYTSNNRIPCHTAIGSGILNILSFPAHGIGSSNATGFSRNQPYMFGANNTSSHLCSLR